MNVEKFAILASRSRTVVCHPSTHELARKRDVCLIFEDDIVAGEQFEGLIQAPFCHIWMCRQLVARPRMFAFSHRAHQRLFVVRDVGPYAVEIILSCGVELHRGDQSFLRATTGLTVAARRAGM